MPDVYLYKPNGIKLPEAWQPKVLEAIEGLAGRSTSLNPDVAGNPGAGIPETHWSKKNDTKSS